jgi:hypothetical protein
MRDCVMMSATEEDWTDPADAAELDTAREVRALEATRGGSEDGDVRSGAETLRLDTGALELCIRADLWP